VGVIGLVVYEFAHMGYGLEIAWALAVDVLSKVCTVSEGGWLSENRAVPGTTVVCLEGRRNGAVEGITTVSLVLCDLEMPGGAPPCERSERLKKNTSNNLMHLHTIKTTRYQRHKDNHHKYNVTR
jgi:hypothetical protein